MTAKRIVANRATLFNFISWTKEHYRAEHYMVVLAGHGAGTEEDFLLKDDSPRNSLSIPALREVFEEVKKYLKINIDILGMDVCLMSMVEICYELNGLVEYLVSLRELQSGCWLALRANPRKLSRCKRIKRWHRGTRVSDSQ